MTPFESIHQQAKILYPKQHKITQKLFSLSVYLFVSSFTVIPFINPYLAVVCFIVSVIITAIVQAIEKHYFILVFNGFLRALLNDTDSNTENSKLK